jgi:hypothetical protein
VLKRPAIAPEDRFGDRAKKNHREDALGNRVDHPQL